MEKYNSLEDIIRYVFRKWYWILIGMVAFGMIFAGAKLISSEQAYRQAKWKYEAELTEEEKAGILLYRQMQEKANEQKAYIDHSILMQVNAYSATYTVLTIKTSQELAVLRPEILKDTIERNDIDMTESQLGELVKQKYIAEEGDMYLWEITILQGQDAEIGHALADVITDVLEQNQIQVVGRAEETIADYELAKLQKEILAQYDEALAAWEERAYSLNERQMIELGLLDKEELCNQKRPDFGIITMLACAVLGVILSCGIAVYLYIFDGIIHNHSDWNLITEGMSSLSFTWKEMTNPSEKWITDIKTILSEGSVSEFGVVYTCSGKRMEHLKRVLQKEFGDRYVETKMGSEYMSPLIIVAEEDHSKIREVMRVAEHCKKEQVRVIAGIYVQQRKQ